MCTTSEMSLGPYLTIKRLWFRNYWQETKINLDCCYLKLDFYADDMSVAQVRLRMLGWEKER